VARDRKRAKQRRARRGREDTPAVPPEQSTGAPPLDGKNGGGGSVRADVPGALDHASADVDEFDAALVRGAGGVPVEAGAGAAADLGGVAADPEHLSEHEIEDEAEAEGDLSEDEIQEIAGAGGAGGGGGIATPEQASGAPQRGGNRAIGFLRASWAELQRVQWPDRRQVFQATAVVLGFVAIAGAYLGLADYVAKEIVEFILS
jgi:preprotein translocase subunit SecE